MNYNNSLLTLNHYLTAFKQYWTNRAIDSGTKTWEAGRLGHASQGAEVDDAWQLLGFGASGPVRMTLSMAYWDSHPWDSHCLG